MILEAARKKEHPDKAEFGGQGHESSGCVEPVRKLLHVPANPCGQRAILVVVVHSGEVTPGVVAAGELDDAGFESRCGTIPSAEETS